MKKELKHVAIILDGNGRWATKRNKNRSYGHKAGFENLRKLTKYIFDKNIKFLSIFAFSTENFKRSKEEVDYLMKLFLKSFKIVEQDLKKRKIKIVFSGREEPLRNDIINEMKRIEKNTKNNKNGTLNICLNYGGRFEIIDACKKIVEDVKHNKIDISEIEEKFNKYLYNDLPDIDLLIRTGGEYRISNFMLYSMSYSEFYFTDVNFPDFNEEEFDKALKIYENRDRRYGGIKNEKNN